MKNADLPLDLNEDFSRSVFAKFGSKFWELGVINYDNRTRHNLYLDKESLEGLQLRKLQSIVSHAYRTVPFYRKLYDSYGVDPASIKTLGDIQNLPVIDKNMLSRLPENHFLSSSYKRNELMDFETGGTTGSPLTVHLSQGCLKRRVSHQLRIYKLHGYSVFDKTAELMYRQSTLSWLNKLGLMRRKVIPYDMKIEGQFEMIQAYNPAVLEGYPSRLVYIADYMRRVKEADRIRPKIIISNSEMLMPEVRARIRDSTGTEPVDVYQCIEFGRIAWQCRKKQKYHINSDYIYLEILDGMKRAADGHAGEIVLTDLHNYSMPLIRYRMNDMAVMSQEKCSCGITFPVLDRIIGRQNDEVLMPDGRKVSSTAITLYRYAGIREYQIIQHKIDALEIILVVDKYFEKDTEKLIDAYFLRFGFRKPDYRYVKKIERTRVQKLKTFVSKMR
jgi:phenylacetate-CoA ligase